MNHNDNTEPPEKLNLEQDSNAVSKPEPVNVIPDAIVDTNHYANATAAACCCANETYDYDYERQARQFEKRKQEQKLVNQKVYAVDNKGKMK